MTTNCLRAALLIVTLVAFFITGCSTTENPVDNNAQGSRSEDQAGGATTLPPEIIKLMEENFEALHTKAMEDLGVVKEIKGGQNRIDDYPPIDYLYWESYGNLGDFHLHARDLVTGNSHTQEIYIEFWQTWNTRNAYEMVIPMSRADFNNLTYPWIDHVTYQFVENDEVTGLTGLKVSAGNLGFYYGRFRGVFYALRRANGIANFFPRFEPVTWVIDDDGEAIEKGPYYSIIPRIPTFAVSGTIFYDLNANGTKDPDENVIEGVTVGIEGGASATSDVNGIYSFPGLVNGAYAISVGEHNGRTHATDASVNFNINGAPATVNFGFFGYMITGSAYFDLDGNGLQENGEPGIEGVSVVLESGASINTDATGNFSFSNLAEGDHIVMAGEYNDRLHSTDATVSITIDGADAFANFGFLAYHISGTVFYDVDGNEVKNEGEPGLAGRLIRLSTGESTSTNENGCYEFGNLLSGNYTIEVEEIASFVSTTGIELQVTVFDGDISADFGYGLDLGALDGAEASSHGMGWWISNIDKAVSGRTRGIQIPAATLDNYRASLQSFAYSPLNFATLAEAYAVLRRVENSAAARLAQHLTASEYNFANGAYLGGDRLATWALVYWGEWVLQNADSFTTEELNNIKDMFESYNEGRI